MTKIVNIKYNWMFFFNSMDGEMGAYGIELFFKQKTAYEIRLSLVGSEMCIRDSLNIINIIVETNYEAYYKMKLQNEWGTFIDLKVLPVS